MLQLQNAPREHSAIFSTFIKLPFVLKTFVLSIFEWPLKGLVNLQKNLKILLIKKPEMRETNVKNPSKKSK